MPHKDPEDRRRYMQTHYQRYASLYKARARAKTVERRDIVRAYLRELKKAPCLDCGGSFPYCAMQFDHVRGEKLFNLGDVTKKYASMKAVDAEIAKCDLVCAVCHAIRTHVRMGLPLE